MAERDSGRPMRFPAVANAVTPSVPDGDVGVAAGTNNALNAPAP